jgi:hypothetical protein
MRLVNRDLASHVTVTINHHKGSNAMPFGPDSQQIEYGSHSLVIDAENRKIRVFSSMDAPEAQSNRDWEGVQGKLSELGVTALSEVPEEPVDGILIAEGAY